MLIQHCVGCCHPLQYLGFNCIQGSSIVWNTGLQYKSVFVNIHTYIHINIVTATAYHWVLPSSVVPWLQLHTRIFNRIEHRAAIHICVCKHTHIHTHEYSYRYSIPLGSAVCHTTFVVVKYRALQSYWTQSCNTYIHLYTYIHIYKSTYLPLQHTIGLYHLLYYFCYSYIRGSSAVSSTWLCKHTPIQVSLHIVQGSFYHTAFALVTHRALQMYPVYGSLITHLYRSLYLSYRALSHMI